jgi:hypothetical protein
MANPDNRKGFTPVAPILASRPYAVDSSNATAIFRGDVIQAEDDGNVAPATAGGLMLLGATDDYLAATTAGTVFVYSDPDQEFLAQDDGAGTLEQTDIFNNTDHVAGAGSALTRLSSHELNGTTNATTTAGFRLLTLIKSPELSPSGSVTDNAVWRCKAVEHHLLTTTGV